MNDPRQMHIKQSFQLVDELVKPTPEEWDEWMHIDTSVSPEREIVTNMYERYAMSHFLWQYPTDASFKDVLELVREGDECIAPWEPFFGCEGYELAHEIEAMRDSLEECFIIREKGNKP